jgi:alkanesulfonate monooxygenase SsuD/methylene tetrahydromethanopterin reductase-like flavin-dependent oxidoreductase (luciferase family)
VGAAHPNAIRRAARFADAFMGAGSQSTAQFVEQVKVLREALAENGREGFPIAKRVYLTVDDDAGRARERLLAGLDRLYGYFRMPGLDAVGVCGPPAAIVESLEEVRAAGAELILLNPLDDDREQMERLAAEVVPSLS